MARSKQTAKRSTPPITTWTRFHLPLEQELPAWPVDHADAHFGPLVGVSGLRRVSLGRMVENPEQAAYIIEWATLEDIKNFQSSPACTEFLRHLPEHSHSQFSIESGTALRHLSMDDDDWLSPSSRFLTFECNTHTPTSEMLGRVTITTFVVPRKVDNVDRTLHDSFKSVFNCFAPDGYRLIARGPFCWTRHASVWFRVLAEDRWVEEKFGKLEPTQEDCPDRTIFCHFLIWPLRQGATREDEEASVADPQARESWKQRIARTMPPATAWVQERWDIRYMFRSDPLEDEFDPEMTPKDIEEEMERRRLQDEYRQLHPPEFDEWLNHVNR